ncbi:MAG: hypothetical protein GY811_07250 [Myxococcales bacterium]|nr:hypothetical protein [Myxococcales bacterium]
MIREHRIDAEKQQQFAGIVTLNYVYEMGGSLAQALVGADTLLEPTLAWLEGRGHLQRSEESTYILSDSGTAALGIYRAQFREFLRTFDIYAFVDLDEAVFAYETFFEFESEDDWNAYIEKEIWADLRIAVAEFKKIDPTTVAFLSFINEGLFNEEGSWQKDLHDAELWQEVQEVCNCSVATEDLAYEDPVDGHVKGIEVLEDIIREGAEMNLELKALEEELSADEPVEEGERDDDEEEIDVDEYYTPHFEPGYVAPVWVTSWSL